MASTLRRPYELPPFELVKLIEPAFVSASSASATAVQQTNRQAGAGPSWSSSSPTSPPPTAAAAAAAGGGQHQQTLGNRLSQLVNPRLAASAASSPPRTAQSPSSTTWTGSPGAPSTVIDSRTPAAPTPVSITKQTVRVAEAGDDAIYVAGNEGSIAVWKLLGQGDDGVDAPATGRRSRAKGKGRSSGDEVTDVPEEIAYLLDQHSVVPGRRPVEKLAVLPTVGKALVLSEGVLSLHALPNFAPLPAFSPIRGVSTFAVDLSDLSATSIPICVIKRKSMQIYRIGQFTIEQVKDLPLRTTAILGVLRRSHLCVADSMHYSLVDLDSATLIPLLPISQDPPEPKTLGDAAIDGADDALPEPARPKSYQRPSIVAVGKDEFLVASHTGHTTLGLFIRENGEPTRGTLEWASNPKSIVIDQPYVVALLQNNTIEVHSLATQEIVQVIQLNSAPWARHRPAYAASSPIAAAAATEDSTTAAKDLFQARGLISCSAGYPNRTRQERGAHNSTPLFVPEASDRSSVSRYSLRLSKDNRDEGLQEVKAAMTAEPESLESPESAQASSEVVVGPNSQPPSTPPKRQMSALSATRPSSAGRHHWNKRLQRSSVAVKTLVLGKDAVLALSPLTLVIQADALIDNNRVEDALQMLDSLGTPDTVEKMEEFAYIHQKAGWTYLLETRFKEAGIQLSRGRTDPRLVLRLFSDLTGGMASSICQAHVSAFKGLQGLLGEDSLKYDSIDGIIRNYAPHLPPSSPTATDLSAKLDKAARSMLLAFLEHWRHARRTLGLLPADLGVDNSETLREVDRLVDTVLAKLYLENPGKLGALLSMLEKEAHDCDVDELAPLLEKSNLHWYIAQLYLLHGRVSETLKVWTELVDGQRTDARFTDGLQKIYNLLENSTNAALVTKYGLWLVSHDRGLGTKLLCKPARGVQLDKAACLLALESIDQQAADDFLENLVFTDREVSSTYHDKLIGRYVARIADLFAQPGAEEVLTKERESYAKLHPSLQTSMILFYLSSDATDPITVLRAKLILLLHASTTYDTQNTRILIEGVKALDFERAMVFGRLGMHNEALTILTDTLRDMPAAEAYCTHAGTGDILGAKQVRSVIAQLGIEHPSALLRKDGRRRVALPARAGLQEGSGTEANAVPQQQQQQQQRDRQAKRRELLNMLIKLSLEQSHRENSPAAQERAAHIIQMQALHIDAGAVIPSVPDSWKLGLMEGFLVRSLRRSLHSRYEGHLQKSLLQGQALETSLRYYELVESLGGTLAEEASDDDDDDVATGMEEEEKPRIAGRMDEKKTSDGEVVYLEKGAHHDDAVHRDGTQVGNEKAIDVL